MRILFMGTPDFAKVNLEAIYQADFEIVGVVTNPDKPQGRGMKLVPSLVKQFALEKDLKLYQPVKIKNNQEFIREIRELRPDVICVVAYGKLLPKEILAIPPYGCINVHASLLPKYRGAAPIQWAVLNGDPSTGITTMYMNEGMDTGDIILQQEVEIGENETTGEVWNKLANIGGELLVKTLQLIEEGVAPREKQGENYSVAPLLDKKMAKIDWQVQTAEQIHNLIRGLNPIMGAYTFLKGKKVKFWKAEKIDLETFSQEYKIEEKVQDLENGTILVANEKQGLYIKAKQDILKIIEIQAENAKRMNVKEYLRGNKVDTGSIFNKGEKIK